MALVEGSVWTRADIRARQKILDVLDATAFAVQDVLAFSRAVDAARDHDLLGDLLDPRDPERRRGRLALRRAAGRRLRAFGGLRSRHRALVQVGRDGLRRRGAVAV